MSAHEVSKDDFSDALASVPTELLHKHDIDEYWHHLFGLLPTKKNHDQKRSLRSLWNNYGKSLKEKSVFNNFDLQTKIIKEFISQYDVLYRSMAGGKRKGNSLRKSKTKKRTRVKTSNKKRNET